MEVELRDHQVEKSSRNQEETKVLEEEENGDSRGKRGDGERAAEEAKKASKDHVVVDVKTGDDGGSRDSERSKDEKVCRICHFGSEESTEGSDQLISLGCDCRGELGVSHQNCAETWFSQRGNRICEICGKTAKNISNSNSNNNTEDTSIFLMDLNEMRLVAATLDSSGESSRRCKRSFCNFLMACLVLAFLVPWFFRGMATF